MALNQPTMIPEPWAEQGQFDTIPNTTAGADPGRASWDVGFPIDNAKPVAQGGIPPHYRDFQGVLHHLSAFAWWQQRGGLFAWDNDIDYPTGSIILGSDGNTYQAIQNSGPGTTAGARNPTTSTGYWVNNSEVVHLSGSETITGTKTFSSNVNFTKSAPALNIKDTGLTAGTAPGSATASGLYMQDSAGTSLGRINVYTRTVGANAVYLRANGFMQAALGNDAIVWTETDATGAMSFHPDTSNTMQLGRSSARWSEVFANTGTINTSDERLKQDVGDYPDAVLDAWGDVEWRQFRFKDSFEKKGESARIHGGLIAQRIAEAFEAHGLDASRYGFFCHDAWEAQPEERDENGEMLSAGIEAGDMYSLRYEECLSIEAAYQRRRADRLEARIAAIEERLNALDGDLR